MPGKHYFRKRMALHVPDVTDAPAEDSDICLLRLPAEVLVDIAARLMPPADKGFAAPPTAWHDVIYFVSACSLTHAAMLEAMRERIQVGEEIGPSALCALIHSLLLGGGASKWKAVRPLRAVRVQTPYSVPMQAPPRLSGGSLCALAPGRLCLFGGRDSASGDTLSDTRLITIRSGIAIWDECLCDPHPAARCYHTGVVWNDGPRSRTELPPMIVFGGASDGDSGHERLLDDVWSASMVMSSTRSSATSTAPSPAQSSPAPSGPPLSWRRLQPAGSPPTARSSHICVSWPGGNALVVQGGLSTDGVLGDTWLLRPSGDGDDGCEWVELHTSGATVKRAHHAGGLVGLSMLLAFSGQDETLLTKHTLCALDLLTATWTSVALPTEGPCWSTRRQAHSGSHCGAPIARIDGAGAAVAGVGLVIFGGVGDDFGFVPAADAWLLRGPVDVRPARRLALPVKSSPVASATAVGGTTNGGAGDVSPPLDVGPCGRACLGLCADGLSLYLFGGFDGEADLSDLWTLDLQPAATGAKRGGTSSTGAMQAFDIDLFKARQARASAVLHGTPALAASQAHLRVGLAALRPVCVDGASSAAADLGHVLSPGMPPVTQTPSTADAVVAAEHPSKLPSYDLSTGLGDGLSRGQRAAVLAAFRD